MRYDVLKDGKNNYDDIIDLPHHQSATRPHMSLDDRAAQFAPFAALTGHAAAIKETARHTENKTELEEADIELLNSRIAYIMENIDSSPYISVTYFLPDRRKSGGAYLTVSGGVRKIDRYKKKLIMEDNTEIPFEDISRIDGEIFGSPADTPV